MGLLSVDREPEPRHRGPNWLFIVVWLMVLVAPAVAVWVAVHGGLVPVVVIVGVLMLTGIGIAIWVD